jgi:hypothetical protein
MPVRRRRGRPRRKKNTGNTYATGVPPQLRIINRNRSCHEAADRDFKVKRRWDICHQCSRPRWGMGRMMWPIIDAGTAEAGIEHEAKDKWLVRLKNGG